MAGHIPEEIIEQVRLRTDIVDVVGSYVQLSRAGSNRHKGLCPFHKEKTPSFTVSEDKQMFYCFGCKAGGNVFTFVMEHEGVDFPTAVRLLADRYGISIPEEDSKEQPQRSNTSISKERLFLLNAEIAAFFERELRGNPSSPVAKYLESRNLPKSIVEKFHLGAARNEWTAALDFCKSKGFSEEEIVAADIAKRNEEKNSVYDRFRNRLMFPIWDIQGRVVGFSGRVVSKDDKSAKYLNTSGTWLFNKSRLLYPFPIAKESIRDQKRAILCEGQMDAIAFHMAGVKNAVAPLGTAFTDEQATILKHHTNEVVVAFDSDTAGLNAALRTGETLLPKSITVKVAVMPGGEDPDAIFKAKGPDALKKIIDDAIDFFDFAFIAKSKEHDKNTPEGKSKIVAEIIKLIASLKSESLCSEQATKLADKLSLPQQPVFNELKKHLRYAAYRPAHSALASSEEPRGKMIQTTDGQYLEHVIKAEAQLLEVALAHGTFAKEIAEKLPSERISQSPVGKALNLVVSMELNGEWEHAEDAIRDDTTLATDPWVSRCMVEPTLYHPDKNTREKKQRQALEECVNSLNTWSHKARLKELKELVATTEDEEEKERLMEEFQTLNRKSLGLPN